MAQALHCSSVLRMSGGGSRQRFARQIAREGSDVTSCKLVRVLLESWAWGSMSPQMVQKIAQAAHEDVIDAKTEIILRHGGNPENVDSFFDLAILSRIGDHGASPNHCARDLRSHIIQTKIADPLVSSIPLKHPLTNRFMVADQSIFLPHSWFSTVYHEYPDAFQRRIVPSHEKVQEFWAAVRRHPQLINHPVLTRKDYRRWAVPYSLHGDGVPVTGLAKSWGKSMHFYSWTSLLVSGPTTAINFYIWALWKNMIANVNCFKTQNKFWRILTWSLHWMWRGLWPDVDCNGNRHHHVVI